MAGTSPEQSKPGAGSLAGWCTLNRDKGLPSRYCVRQECWLLVARGVVFPSMHCMAHAFWEKLLEKESCNQGNLKEAALSNTRLQSRNAHA